LNAVEARDYGLIDEVLGDTDDLLFLSPQAAEKMLQLSGQARFPKSP